MTRPPFIPMTEAALDALAEGLREGEHDESLVDAVVERVGDGLRAEVPLPQAVRAWFKRCALIDLGGVLRRTAERLNSTALPASTEDFDTLARCVGERDRAESVLVGVRFACARAGHPLEKVRGLEEVFGHVATIDAHLRERFTRDRVEDALGMRLALLDEQGWTSPLRERVGDAEADAAEPRWKWPASVHAIPRPADATVARYVERGEHAKIVEACAAEDAGFADTLAETIDAFRFTKQPISFLARLWEQQRASARRQPAREAPVVVPLRLRYLQAAATRDTAPSDWVELGVLGATRAEASLEVSEAGVRLDVRSGELLVKEISLGGKPGVRGARDGDWTVHVDTTRDPLNLLVVCANGLRFEERLSLFDEPSP
jgi:hypothetical protein